MRRLEEACMRKIMTRVAIALLLAIPSLTVRMVSAADPIKSVQISNSEWTGEAKDLGPMWMTIDSVTSDGYVIGQINMRTWFRKLGNFQPDAASGNAKIDGNTITIRMSVSDRKSVV